MNEPLEGTEQALVSAITSAWNVTHDWMPDEAIKLAYAVLEDANCHDEAALLM